METKEIKINPPEGFEIDKENSTFECIKFKPIKKELPKTWEEYCITHPIREREHWINNLSRIVSDSFAESNDRNCETDKNILPNKEYAEAILALCQLIQLRECYNDGWMPDWTRVNNKYTIYTTNNILVRNINTNVSCILAFKTEEIRDKFLSNFRGLIEIAKPLL